MPDNTPDNFSCNFCGKLRKEVDKLVAGPEVYICNECIELSHRILQADNEEETILDTENVPTPEEIKAHLDEFVIGQDDAKITLAVSAYNHYKRILFNDIKHNEIEKSNVLMLGPSGTGKTLLVKTLSDFLKVPFAVADATTLTEAGYVGEDVESVLQRLYKNSNNNLEDAQRGIVFIDEIDKKSRSSESNTNTRDVSGQGVQQALLRLVEGTVVEIAEGSKAQQPKSPIIEFDTTNVLFITAGAFVGIEDIVNKRLSKGSKVGFKGAVDLEKPEIKCIPEDLIMYGLIPELVGRFPIITKLDELTEEQFVSIMKNSKRSVTKQYQELFLLDGIELNLLDDFYRDVAAKVKKSKVGARGIRSLCEECFKMLMYYLPKLNKKQIQSIEISNLTDKPILNLGNVTEEFEVDKLK